jgi:hypothetical protein
MSIYRSRIDYRRIYEQTIGEIPVDEDGRTYEIHHVDGNRENNSQKNLIAVSIKEHYDIHESQGDWAACIRILSRMNKTPDEISKLASELSGKASRERVMAGTHNWLDGKIQRETQQRLVKSGEHHFLGSTMNEKRLDDGSHHFLGNSNPAFTQLQKGIHQSQYKWVCQHCGKEGRGKVCFNRWHGDNCKTLSHSYK